MANPRLTDEDIALIKQALETAGGIRPAKRLLDEQGTPFSHGSVSNVARGVVAHRVPPPYMNRKVDVDYGGERGRVTVRSLDVKTLEQALAVAEVDLGVWEVDRYKISSSEVTCRIRQGQTDEGRWRPDRPETYTNWHIWAILKRKSPNVRSAEMLLAEMRKHAVQVPKLKRRARSDKRRRALEVCIMDPHLGLETFRPGSDAAWSLDECEQHFLWAADGLLKRAEPFGPFEEVVWLFGNDFLHSDTVFHTTTAGTGQPECVAWHTMYERGKKLAIAAGDMLKAAGPLRIVQISGNHDRIGSFTLAHVLESYYHHDANVTVEVSPAPYKFWQFGVNLIGFDHGHAKKMDRLAALMANETRRTGWADARYCEWHLGDQHRRGGGRPTVLAEQGVGVEFLTGLVPANEWHKIKTFNWQPRGAVAYVWDHESGPEARLHVNIDSYTGKPLEGAK